MDHWINVLLRIQEVFLGRIKHDWIPQRLDSGRFRSLLARDTTHPGGPAMGELERCSLDKRIGWETEKRGSNDHRTHGLEMRDEIKEYLHEEQEEMVLKNSLCFLRDLVGD